MKSEPARPPLPGRGIVWGGMATALVLYMVLILAVLPARTFFSNDAGVRFIQVDSLVSNRWRGLWITYYGEALDRAREFTPFNTASFYEDARYRRVYGTYSVPFVAVTGFLYERLGFPGLYVLPLVSTLGTMWVTYCLSLRYASRLAWLSPLLVGFLSPFLFYSLDLWEHSPSAFFASLGVLLVVEGVIRGRPLWLLGAGLSVGLAVWFRAEAYAMILACGLAFPLFLERKRVASLLGYGVGLVAILVPLWAFLWINSGTPVGPHVKGIMVPQVSGQVARQLHMHPLAFRAFRILASTTMLLPWNTSTSWTVLVVGLVALRALAGLVPAWRRRVCIVLAGSVSLGVVLVVVRGMLEHWDVRNVVQSFPVVLFLLFLGLVPSRVTAQPVAPSSEPARRVRLLALVLVVFVTVACLMSPSEGGGQWGARFLLAAYPLLAVLLVHALQRTLEALPVHIPWRTVPLIAFIVLCLASGLTQFEGLRHLYWSKADYERLTQAAEQLSSDVVVTDIWWLRAVTAAADERKMWFLVDHGGNGSLSDLVALLRQEGVPKFTYVTTPEGLESSSALFAGPFMTEQSRHTEQIWLDVAFVTYTLAAE